MGDAALAYRRRGWSIVPMHSPVDGRCSCGRRDCVAVAKHPRVSWEARVQVAATEHEVEEWWRRWPNANIGIVTGRVSGIVAVDVDPRSGGDSALRGLEERWGALPATPEVRIGGGGRHLWFSCNQELPSTILAPGLELKAERSVVTAPPSVHATGHRYVWIPGRDPDELTSATVPRWLELIAHRDAGVNRQADSRAASTHVAGAGRIRRSVGASGNRAQGPGTVTTSVRSTTTITPRFISIARTAAGIASGVGAEAGLDDCGS